jgi:hypothetical protein
LWYFGSYFGCWCSFSSWLLWCGCLSWSFSRLYWFARSCWCFYGSAGLWGWGIGCDHLSGCWDVNGGRLYSVFCEPTVNEALSLSYLEACERQFLVGEVGDFGVKGCDGFVELGFYIIYTHERYSPLTVIGCVARELHAVDSAYGTDKITVPSARYT